MNRYKIKLRRQADTFRADLDTFRAAPSVCGTARCFRLPLWHLFRYLSRRGRACISRPSECASSQLAVEHPIQIQQLPRRTRQPESKLHSSMRYMSDFYTSAAWKSKREAILSRDGYMCRNCKRYGRQRPATTVHHIKHFDEFPELALESDNLISLCEACHNLMHPEKAKKSNKSRGNRRYF